MLVLINRTTQSWDFYKLSIILWWEHSFKRLKVYQGANVVLEPKAQSAPKARALVKWDAP